MPVNQVAEIKMPDPRTLVISPWDASCLKNIEKAILASDLGINPQNDGKVIRLAFPQPTEERRKELAKKAEKFAEECKIAVRNVRRDANEKAKEMKKNGDMTEDEQKASEKQVQDLSLIHIYRYPTALHGFREPYRAQECHPIPGKHIQRRSSFRFSCR